MDIFMHSYLDENLEVKTKYKLIPKILEDIPKNDINSGWLRFYEILLHSL